MAINSIKWNGLLFIPVISSLQFSKNRNQGLIRQDVFDLINEGKIMAHLLL